MAAASNSPQSFAARARRARISLLNIAKLVSGNRFTAPYRSDYDDVVTTPQFALRRYTRGRDSRGAASGTTAGGSHILLVPPLMVTPEIYDMAPELSLVAWLLDHGHNVWAVDFGRPDVKGGWRRDASSRQPEADDLTEHKDLEDHILAVSDAVTEVAGRVKAPIHLLGYSQGGMFVYQAAAYRHCQDVASLITMGSPVDFLRNLPGRVHVGVWSNLLRVTEDFIRAPFSHVPGVPGKLASVGFKLVSPRQELKHFLEFLRFLDDEQELKRLEPSRRFMGGEGFIAWPGPALRTFVDDFVVHNRMLSGGFVVAGRTVSLSDISAPVLYFFGRRDKFARPDSVQAISRVLPHDEAFPMLVETGHLGLVIGTRARDEVWPAIDAWLSWRQHGGALPPQLKPPSTGAQRPVQRRRHASPVLYAARRAALRQAGQVALDATRLAHWTRWQVPRLLRLARIWDSAPMSIGRTLAAQAQAIPNRTFFLWEGRAYSYAEADARVTRIAAALYECGIRAGQAVGLLMENHPDCLSALAALSRLGAAPVLINPATRGVALQHAISVGQIRDLIVGPGQRDLAETTGVRHLYIGAPLPPAAASEARDADPAPAPLPASAVDLERIHAQLPADLPRDPGRAADIAFLMFTSGTTGQPKAARISNRRFMMAATATCAGCDLTPTDTVYCCLPLHHGTGLLMAAGGALLGGCRLALAPRFSTRTFWQDVRRTGATIVFYVGELCRYLVAAPPSPLERAHAVRLFVGNGLRADVWRELLRRFGRVSVLEFYGSTEGNVVMANLTGEKIGSVGRPPFGLMRTLLAQYDPVTGQYGRNERGFIRPAATNEPGMLLVAIDAYNPVSRFDGYTDAAATEAKIVRSVLASGDAWFSSGDLLREDADGDYWFVDRVGDTYRWKSENVSTEQVTDVLLQLPFVALATVYGVQVPGHEGRAGMAALTLQPGCAFDPGLLFQTVERELEGAARPRFLRIVERLQMTDSLKIVKHTLQAEGIELSRTGPLYVYDKQARTYALVAKDEAELAARCAAL